MSFGLADGGGVGRGTCDGWVEVDGTPDSEAGAT